MQAFQPLLLGLAVIFGILYSICFQGNDTLSETEILLRDLGLHCGPSYCDKYDILYNITHLAVEELQLTLALVDPVLVLKPRCTTLVRDSVQFYRYHADSRCALPMLPRVYESCLIRTVASQFRTRCSSWKKWWMRWAPQQSLTL
jgi:hypothetical protein